jgi:hypothetical protein
MATKKKSATKVRSPYKDMKKSHDDNKAYVVLRTYLDSLELGALRYVLSAPTAKGKRERAEQVEAMIKPTIEFVWGQREDMDCPEGYIDCYGVCVSYPCMN